MAEECAAEPRLLRPSERMMRLSPETAAPPAPMQDAIERPRCKRAVLDTGLLPVLVTSGMQAGGAPGGRREARAVVCALVPPPPPPLVLIGHAASLTPY
jgi:hypothetical protein